MFYDMTLQKTDESLIKGKNFRNKNFDGLDLSFREFVDCDLRGANMSETNLTGSSFKNCLLTDVCMCESDLTYTAFIDCDLTRLDIAACILNQTFFNSAISMNLNFKACEKLNQVLLRRENDMTVFSLPPIVLKGLPVKVVIFDHDVLIGDAIQPISDHKADDITPNKSANLRERILQCASLMRPNAKSPLLRFNEITNEIFIDRA